MGAKSLNLNRKSITYRLPKSKILAIFALLNRLICRAFIRLDKVYLFF